MGEFARGGSFGAEKTGADLGPGMVVIGALDVGGAGAYLFALGCCCDGGENTGADFGPGIVVNIDLVVGGTALGGCSDGKNTGPDFGPGIVVMAGR